MTTMGQGGLFGPDGEVPQELRQRPLPDPHRPVDGKAGRTHPSTSKRAAANVRYKVGSQKAKLVEALRLAGIAGLTAAEAAHFIGRSRNQTATRLLELHEDGWADFARDVNNKIIERPTDDNGNMGRVHILSLLGRAELEAR